MAHRRSSARVPGLVDANLGDTSARDPKVIGRPFQPNRAHPHASLGRGVPDPPPTPMLARNRASRHRLGAPLVVRAKSMLGGLHHAYSLAPTLARSNSCGLPALDPQAR